MTITNIGSLPVNFTRYDVFGSSDFGLFIDEMSVADHQANIAEGGEDMRCRGMASAMNDPRINTALLVDPDSDGVEVAPGEAFTICATWLAPRGWSDR